MNCWLCCRISDSNGFYSLKLNIDVICFIFYLKSIRFNEYFRDIEKVTVYMGKQKYCTDYWKIK